MEETGAIPLTVDIEERIVSFWSRMSCNNNNNNNNNNQTTKLSITIYRYVHRIAQTLPDNTLKNRFPWFFTVKSILIKCGLNDIWNDQQMINPKWIKLAVKRKLKDIFLSNWYSLIENSSNSQFYKCFKNSFGYESYLHTTPRSLLFPLIRFRTRNHRLPIETGNWNRTPINDRKCQTCNKIGDEFHFLFECVTLENERKQYIKPYFYRHPNMFKLEKLFNTNSKKVFLNLCKMIKTILNQYH